MVAHVECRPGCMAAEAAEFGYPRRQINFIDQRIERVGIAKNTATPRNNGVAMRGDQLSPPWSGDSSEEEFVRTKFDVKSEEALFQYDINAFPSSTSTSSSSNIASVISSVSTNAPPMPGNGGRDVEVCTSLVNKNHAI